MIGGGCAVGLSSELAPSEDRNALLIQGTLPDGSTPAAADALLRRIEEVVDPLPERLYAAAYVGIPDPVSFRLFLVLTPAEQRTRDVQAVAADLRRRLASVPGAKINVVVPASPSRTPFARPVQVVLKGPVSREVLQQAAERLIAQLKARVPGLTGFETDLKAETPRVEIGVDRVAAAAAGVSVSDVAETVRSAIGQRRIGYYNDRDRQYRIVSETDLSRRTSFEVFRDFTVRNAAGALVPVAPLLRRAELRAPAALNRYDRSPSVTIGAGLSEGAVLGDALQAIEAAAPEVLPPGVQLQRAGSARDLSDSVRIVSIALPAAALAVFGLLAILYESFAAAAAVLCTVPLTLAVVPPVLWLSGQTLNLYTQAGLLMLVGLVTKHGTLMVDAAERLRREGLPTAQAARAAVRERLRPVIMTTAAMTVGTLPLMFASGAGAASRRGLGLVLAAGLPGGTVLIVLCMAPLYALCMRMQGPRT